MTYRCLTYHIFCDILTPIYEVENLMPKEECQKRGHSFRWTINDRTLLAAHKEEVMDKLGLSQEECDSLINKIKDLWKELDYSLDS